MKENYLHSYLEFVDAVTSDASRNKEDFINRINQLYDEGCDVSRLHTAADGLVAEAGEFMEIIKKLTFQGKPWNEENQFHLKRELGDVLWYFAQACMALDIDPYEVIDENIRKLESRYPGGKFEIERSEIRKSGDI